MTQTFLIFALIPLLFDLLPSAYAGPKKGECHVTLSNDITIYHKKDVFKVKKGLVLHAEYELSDGVAKGVILDECIRAARDQFNKPVEDKDVTHVKNGCELIFRERDFISCKKY